MSIPGPSEKKRRLAANLSEKQEDQVILAKIMSKIPLSNQGKMLLVI